jgi:hypothetical protein
MAFVDLPVASVTFTMVDGSGSQGSVSFNIPAATTIADALTAANQLRPLITALTGCGVVAMNITYSSIETTPTGLAADYSRIERKGVFSFRTAAGKSVSYQIPGILDAIVLPDGRIDEDVTEVSAFLVDLVAAPWTDSNGVDLTALTSAFERYRRTSRPMLPSKKTPDANLVAG